MGGDRGQEPGRKGMGGGREKSGRWERKEWEAGVFRGPAVGDHVDKTLKKISRIYNNFNIIM